MYYTYLQAVQRLITNSIKYNSIEPYKDIALSILNRERIFLRKGVGF
jgi:hypothetical protein